MNAAPSRRRALAGIGSTLLLAAAGRPAAAQDGEAKAPALPDVGSALPLPDVRLLDGRVLPAADARGRVVVVYWWASWCPFCAVQTPLINQLWLAQRGRGLALLALSIDRRASDATAYLARHGYAFPAALLTPELAQNLPKPRGLPVTVVRGRDGRVVAAEAGQLFAEDIADFARFL